MLWLYVSTSTGKKITLFCLIISDITFHVSSEFKATMFMNLIIICLKKWCLNIPGKAI